VSKIVLTDSLTRRHWFLLIFGVREPVVLKEVILFERRETSDTSARCAARPMAFRHRSRSILSSVTDGTLAGKYLRDSQSQTIHLMCFARGL
jgi:hypothetical protein